MNEPSTTMNDKARTSAAPDSVMAVPLDDASDARVCGHKAATLARLRRKGHEVPDGFVLPAGRACSREVVAIALERLGPGPYAVRSSGIAEDLADASFAGQYATVLGAKTLDDVVGAVERVRASASAEQVGVYSAHIHRGAAGMAVLVQRLVDADAAGVVFSANPVTGDPEVVIEAVRGLGDRLLAGEVEGDRWIVRDGEVLAERDTGALSKVIVRKLAELAKRLSGELGAPQDVEWALRGDVLHVLQARPITGLPVKPTIEIPPGRWMKEPTHFPGLMSPIGADYLLPVYEKGFAHCLPDWGLPLDLIRHRSFGGEVYTQDVDVGGKHDPSAPPPWWVMAIAVRVIPAIRRRLRAAESAIAGGKLEEYPRRWESSWRDECRQRIERALAVDLEALGDHDLLRELRRVFDDVLVPGMVIHFQLTIPYMVGVSELVAISKELLGWETPRAMDLLTGLSTASTSHTRELAAIAAEIPESVLAGGIEAVRKTSAGARLDAWLAFWGAQTIDSDPGTPSIRERGDFVIRLLREARPASEGVARRRREAVAEARAILEGRPTDRARFDAALAFAEKVYPQRDDNVPYTESLPCGVARRVLLEIGKRLVAKGVLRSVADVAFLEVDELREGLEGSLDGERATARIQRRHAERAWVRAHPGPAFHGPAPVPMPDLRALPAPVRRLMRALVFSMNEEMLAATAKSDADGAIVGVGASSGSYTGPARVIATEADLGRLEPGDVLVCPTTTPHWAVVFGRVGALVTEGGGMLSHPAILAREHDIPAVVATGNATKVIRDGQIVTVDGARGRVVVTSS